MTQAGQNTGQVPSRRSLAARAAFWRGLQSLGSTLDWCLNYEVRSHLFMRTIEVSKPFTPGQVPLYFYLPKLFTPEELGKRYPIVVNFHGGGFTIGDARDDIRWANQVCDELDVVVVSVGYRKAPQFPYPVAVQDGVAALDYLASNAEDLGIDITKMALSGFSSGGNLTFTVPLLYYELQQKMEEAQTSTDNPQAVPAGWSNKQFKARFGSQCQIIALAGFYPSLNYMLTREERRATNPKPSENLPPALTVMFDHSYLPVRAEEAKEVEGGMTEDCPLREPFLSPSLACDGLLKHALPKNIFLLTCENDMLQKEGQDFAEKLSVLGKEVKHFKALNCKHAWDKIPSVLNWGEKATWSEQQIQNAYAQACEVLKQALSGPH